MRNSVAKKLRKESGSQESTSNQLEYEYRKKEHNKVEVSPKIKRSKRQLRLYIIWPKRWRTKSTIKSSESPVVGDLISKLKG